MLGNILPPFTTMQECNLDWILTKVKNILRFVPDDGQVGQILRRTRSGAEWSDEQGGGGAVNSVNGQTGDVVLTAADVGALPDTTPIPTNTSDLNNDSGFITAAQAPVQSVNGQTGSVTLSIPTKTSDLNNDSGFVNAAGAASAAPVQSVNGQTGNVTIPYNDGEFHSGDTLTGQFFLYGFTQNTIKDCSLFFDTPKKIPDGLTITATCTNVNWVIAASGALLQSGGTLKSVTKQNDYQLNIIVSFPNTFTGYYSCVVPITGLVITFS